MKNYDIIIVNINFKLVIIFVILASDKPDLGLEELSSLNVKSRFQAFENATTNGNSNMEKSPISVKRSPSILSKLAKYVIFMRNLFLVNKG